MSTTDQWQQRLIDSWEPGTLVLTSGSRLARQLRHRYRLRQIGKGRSGWRPLEAQSLNSWLYRFWADLWEDTAPAGVWFRLRLWQELAASLPPPADLDVDLGLSQALDETYGVLIRHGLDPAGGKTSSPLLAWRRRICEQFTTCLRDEGRWHPAELPLRVSRALEAGRAFLPETLVLAAFEAPAPIEVDLFWQLSRHTRVSHSLLPSGEAARVRAFSLPDPEQEVLHLAKTLIHCCQELNPGQIGVVVPNLESYAHRLKSTLATFLGHPATAMESTFNITLGTPLLEHPLVQAALLPLRLLVEEDRRPLLVSLLLSPYYRLWSGRRRRLARLDRLWREQSPEAGVESLLTAAQRREPDLISNLVPGKEDLGFLLEGPRRQGFRPVADWKRLLENIWDLLQFPVLADEADRVAHRHLEELLSSLTAELATTSLDASGLLAWLRHGLAGKLFQVGASEQAGVQVMGLIESRGLTFERLFLLGMTSTALPQPVRPLPFLGPEERPHLQAATLKSQYEFGRSAFQHLLAVAPDITLLRPEQVDGEPMPPTPFWPGPWENLTVPPYQMPDAAWARASWLRSAWRGLTRLGAVPGQESLQEAVPFPEKLPVSALAVACQCPFRFLVQELLGLEPLPPPAAGLPPELRGLRLHRVLACITRRLRGQRQGGSLDWERVLPEVEACMDEVLADVADDPLWRLERRRWLGEKHGLLREWLQAEAKHREEGWRWLAEEIPFSGLTLEGWPVELAGRIDRLDFHPEAGFICWDYKSGASPGAAEIFEHLSEPQLPAYLLALSRGLLELDSPPPLHERSLQAGYISLKSEKETRLQRLGADAAHWQRFLEDWQEHLAELGRRLQSGSFEALPLAGAPESRRRRLCACCAFISLCNRTLPSASQPPGLPACSTVGAASRRDPGGCGDAGTRGRGDK